MAGKSFPLIKLFAMTSSHQAVLQKNMRKNLMHTLENLSDQKCQVKYKQAVPFVHVPRELLAQWDEYSRLLKERCDWFIKGLTQHELAALAEFDIKVVAFTQADRLPDVPEIFEVREWVKLMDDASQLRAVLRPNRTECEQDDPAN
jgi:hypothetical protein